MSEIVEKVARVLEPQAWAALGAGDTLAYKNRRTSSLRKARAAIEAMREPSAPMVQAGATSEDAVVGSSENCAAATYRAMIQAALTPSEREG